MSSSRSPRFAVKLTNEARNIYDLRDGYLASTTNYPDFYYALHQPISKFTVEFLYTNDVKPHVVFKVNFRNVSSGGFRSARLSMEITDDYSGNRGAGAPQVKLCTYSGRTTRATGGFEFAFSSNRTLADISEVIVGSYDPPNATIRGRLPEGYTRSLYAFEFLPFGQQQLFDGCRDWIAQVFVRLHAFGWVQWTIKGIVVADNEINIGEARDVYQPRQGSSAINWKGAGFHDIIDKFFDKPIAGRNGSVIVYYHDLPLEFGMFDPRFTRSFSDYNSRRFLPYRVMGGQESDGRSAGRGGSASGSGASSSRGGSGRGGTGPSGYGGSSAYGGGSGSGASSSRGGGSAYDYGSGGSSAYSGGGGSSAYSGGGGSAYSGGGGSAYSGGGGSAYGGGEGYNYGGDNDYSYGGSDYSYGGNDYSSYGGGSGSGTNSRRGGGSGSRGSGGGYSGGGGSYY